MHNHSWQIHKSFMVELAYVSTSHDIQHPTAPDSKTKLCLMHHNVSTYKVCWYPALSLEGVPKILSANLGFKLVTKLLIQAFQSTLAKREHTYDMHVKGCFHLHVLRFLNDGVEMLTKVVIKLFMQVIFSSFDARQYGERIMKIGWKLRNLWLFKACHYIESCYCKSHFLYMETALKWESPSYI